MAKKPESWGVKRPNASSAPQAYSSKRDEAAPKPPSIPGRVPDGRAVGFSNEKRAARAIVKAVLAKLRGEQ